MSVATARKRWTLQELHSLPDDGNKYELVHGALFVTPPPSNVHETVLARLNRLLVGYVDAQRLGLVYPGTPAVRRHESEVLPDIIVRAEAPGVLNDWENAPTPLLVVEILSDSTRRRDMDQKRAFYMTDVRVPEYWAVDPDVRVVRVMRQGAEDRVASDLVRWMPEGASEALTIDLAALFA